MEDIILKKVLTLPKFQKDIQEFIERTGADYIDAVLNYCEKHNIEIDTIATLIKSSVKLKSHIQSEAEDLNFLPKSAKLPI